MIEIVLDILGFAKRASKVLSKVSKVAKDLPALSKAVNAAFDDFVLHAKTPSIPRTLLNEIKEKGIKIEVRLVPNTNLNTGVPIKVFDGKLITVRYKDEIIGTFKTDKEAKKFLDEINKDSKKLNASYRSKILEKWSSKFELKFHDHFDGEIVVLRASRRNATEILWITGAHNHTINGKIINIKTIRNPEGIDYKNLPADIPFRANVEYRFSNRLIPKRNTSSFFPKNWDIVKIKEEIALVYDKMKKSGISFRYNNNKYISFDNDGKFQIQIEFDSHGNLTNAYPIIN